MRRSWSGEYEIEDEMEMQGSSADDVVGKIVDIVAIELNVRADDVRRSRSFRAEFKMDSIAAANILFAIEESLDLSFEGTAIKHIDMVDHLVELVRTARATP